MPEQCWHNRDICCQVCNSMLLKNVAGLSYKVHRSRGVRRGGGGGVQVNPPFFIFIAWLGMHV